MIAFTRTLPTWYMYGIYSITFSYLVLYRYEYGIPVPHLMVHYRYRYQKAAFEPLDDHHH